VYRDERGQGHGRLDRVYSDLRRIEVHGGPENPATFLWDSASGLGGMAPLEYISGLIEEAS
jgi:hypothetical protein